MKKLTLSEAKKLSSKYFTKLKGTEQEAFTPMHSYEVAALAKTIASKYKKADAVIIEIAGILHDIGYAEGGKEGHAEKSVEIIQREGFEVNETLKDCILNHSGDKKPLTAEGKIIQLCDKATTFNPKLIELIIKDGKGKVKPEDLLYLRKMSEKTIELLKKFEY